MSFTSEIAPSTFHKRAHPHADAQNCAHLDVPSEPRTRGCAGPTKKVIYRFALVGSIRLI